MGSTRLVLPIITITFGVNWSNLWNQINPKRNRFINQFVHVTNPLKIRYMKSKSAINVNIMLVIKPDNNYLAKMNV